MPSTSQYDWKYRRYRRGNIASCNFDDVVSKKVRIRLDSLMWYPYTRTSTPFKDVELNPFQGNPQLTSFLRGMRSTPTHPRHIWSEFKQAIFENWRLDKTHVIGASSGYDSRLIAKAVKELYREHGKDWLGETYFVECSGEAEGFEEIMRTLGWWDRSIVWIPRFDYKFFENHHERYNGLCAYPMNQWYDFYVKNWNEEDIQYISGYGGNVADAMNPNSRYMGPEKRHHGIRGRLMMYFRKQYFYQISAFRQPKYSFHPFWSWKYIQATQGIEIHYDRTSVFLADQFVPECKHVKRMRIEKEVTKNGHRHVNPRTTKKLHDWYMSTKFGRRFHCLPNRKVEYNKWWLMFCIAKYVEANNIGIC